MDFFSLGALEGAVAVTGDGRVVKRVLRAGTGRAVRRGDVVALHVEAFFFDKASGARVQCDSTRARGHELSFALLSEPSLLGLENALLYKHDANDADADPAAAAASSSSSCRVGERALVRMSCEYALGAQGGLLLGHGRRVPGGAAVELELELTHAAGPEQLQELDREREKPLAERMQLAQQKKERGNTLFAQGQTAEAAQQYRDAIALLRLVLPSSEEKSLRATLLVPLCLNLAQCLLRLDLPKEAEAYVATALHDEPDNPKGLYRMALCKLRLQEPEEAKEHILKSIKIRDSPEARQLLKEITEALLVDKRKKEETYKKIFAKE